MVFETLKSSRRSDSEWAVRSEPLELLTFKCVMSYSYKAKKEQRSPLLSPTMTKKKKSIIWTILRDQKKKKNSIIWTILRLALLYNSENLEIIKMNKICVLLLIMKLYMEHTNIQSINCFHLTLYLRGIVNIIKKDAQYNIVKHIKNMCNMTLFLFKLR